MPRFGRLHQNPYGRLNLITSSEIPPQGAWRPALQKSSLIEINLSGRGFVYRVSNKRHSVMGDAHANKGEEVPMKVWLSIFA